MKKSDIFNLNYPLPTDRYVMRTYKEFVAFQKDVTNEWRRDVINQTIGMRGYIDLKDCRMTVHDEGKDFVFPTITLRPFVGLDILARFEYYVRFFEMYKSYTDAITKSILQGIEQELTFTNLKEYKIWKKANDIKIHSLVVLLGIICGANNQSNLTLDHIEAFKLNAELTFDQARLDQLINDIGFDTFMPAPFFEGRGFYRHPNSDLVGSFYKYVRKQLERERNDAELISRFPTTA